MKQKVMLNFLLLLTFFLDAQLGYLFSAWTGYQLVFSSQLFLLVLAQLALATTSFFYYPYLILLGIFYDAFYLGQLGLTVWLFPLTVYGFRLVRPLISDRPLERFLYSICWLFVYSLLLYGLGWGLGLTRYPITYFITFNLAPSLGLNALYLGLLEWGRQHFS